MLSVFSAIPVDEQGEVFIFVKVVRVGRVFGGYGR